MNRTSSRRTAPKAKFGAKDASLLIQCYGEKSAPSTASEGPDRLIARLERHVAKRAGRKVPETA